VKITALETIRLTEFPNLIWVRLHTDQGLIGLGETFRAAETVETYLHAQAAQALLGEDPLDTERLARRLRGYLGFVGTGVEMRGNSAVDIALWDLKGQAAGLPLYHLLGGLTRPRIRIYNTCAGYQYSRKGPQRTANWGLGQHQGPYEDLEAFLHRADELAQSLLEQGITAMKIWPFDFAAEASGGHDITPAELERALGPFAKIRRAVGDKMEVMAEFHSLWNLPTAQRIARALAPYGTYWHEDPIRMDSLADLAAYAAASLAPVCASETLATRWSFRDLLETRAVGVVMLDVAWCGGLTEARAIAQMADAWHLPVAPHDCTGPVVLTASTHLSLSQPNALIQETVRAFYSGWYRDLLTDLPDISGGTIGLSTNPGLGTALLPDLPRRADATVRLTRAS